MRLRTSTTLAIVLSIAFVFLAVGARDWMPGFGSEEQPASANNQPTSGAGGSGDGISDEGAMPAEFQLSGSGAQTQEAGNAQYFDDSSSDDDRDHEDDHDDDDHDDDHESDDHDDD